MKDTPLLFLLPKAIIVNNKISHRCRSALLAWAWQLRKILNRLPDYTEKIIKQELKKYQPA
jgi:hypothetical protein